jgi:hypothetical protein
MTRWLMAFALLGCAPDGQCIDAPVYREASTEAPVEVIIPVVLHSAARSLYDEDRTDAVVSFADNFWAQYGVRIEVVEHTEDFYWPVIDDAAPDCDALHTWADDRPRDNRLHVYMMDMIREEETGWYDGVASRGAIALTWRAKLPTLAHEIGHLLSLRHKVDPGNLMFAKDHPGAIVLDEEQEAAAFARAVELYE